METDLLLVQKNQSELRPEVSEATAPPFMRVSNLTKKFGSFTAVEDFSAEVHKGETLALLGPSGCGKTTILRCIAGLETPTAGSIEIENVVAFHATRRINLTPENRELGMVFQSYAIWPHMTVADNVGFPLKVRGIPQAQITKQVSEILTLMGLDASGKQRATDLSGGQQQRVALARALVHRPRLVLFDEPMSNLDAKLREQMRLELKMLQERLKFTAIYVTHDQSEAFALAHRIIIMNRGRIEAAGQAREIFREPATRFVASYFGLNVLEGHVVAIETSDNTSMMHAQVSVAKRLRLWGRVPAGHSVSVGSKIALCVRKEHVHLAAQSPAAPVVRTGDGSERQCFQAEVRVSAFQGTNDEYVVAIDGVEFRALHHSIGTNIHAAEVFLDRHDCIILPGGPL